MTSKALVVIPTFNERENIKDIIDAVLSQGDFYHVLVVDDNSPDGTRDHVEQKILEHPEKVFLLKREGKLGLGTAYIAGFKFGIEKDFDYIFEMDADFSHNPNDLNRLLEACIDQEADLAIGSRYIEGGGLKDWPWERLLLSRMASVYVRLVTNMPIADSTAGFKCYKSNVLKSIHLDKIKCTGYAFQIEMKYASYLQKFKLQEVPIIFKDREKGQSKMSGKIILEALRGVISMKLKSSKGYYN
jgi:dolichol-phosphate mannosyltransferase